MSPASHEAGRDETPEAAAERRARTALAVAALITGLGLAVAGTASRSVGGVIALVGWVVLVGALHAFGRASREPS